jgi:type IV secretion system protein VirB3
MVAGVTYSYAVANLIVSVEFFLIFKSFWVLAAPVILHLVGVLGCLRDPRFFDIWLTRARTCPRGAQLPRLWQANSYAA